MSDKAAEIQKELDRSEAIVALGAGSRRTYFDGLSKSDGDAFLAKATSEQDAEVDRVAKAALEADPVVYTTDDGTEIRKSDGALAVKQAKDNDDLRKRLASAEANTADTALEKRANDELGRLPGTVAVKKALLKAVGGITKRDDEGNEVADTETITGIQAIFKAANDTFDSVLSKGLGTEVGLAAADIAEGGDDASGAEAQLDALAKKHQEANSGMSFAKAYDAVTKTDEGRALYNQVVNAA